MGFNSGFKGLMFSQALFIFKFSKAATLLNKLHQLKINKHSDSYKIKVIGDKSINFQHLSDNSNSNSNNKIVTYFHQL